MFGEEVQDTEYTLVEVGEYNAVLGDVSMDDSGNHPYVELIFTLDGSNRKMWKRLYVSDGTAKKFLPWQVGVLGIKAELDAANLTSHLATAKKMMELLGTKVGTAYSIDVKITEGQDGRQYNDLVVISAAIQASSVSGDIEAHDSLTPAPTLDTGEALPF